MRSTSRLPVWFLAMLGTGLAASCGSSGGGSSDGNDGGAEGGVTDDSSVGASDASTSGDGSPSGDAPSGDSIGFGDTHRPGTGDSGEDATCGATKVEAAPRNVNILVVLDESGSMEDTPTGFSVDKWSAVKTALEEALTAVAARAGLGLILYPYLETGTPGCDMPTGAGVQVNVRTGETTLPKIVAALKASAPGGGTPTAEALRRAYDYWFVGDGRRHEGDENYVLLATDGGPNCNGSLTCAKEACTVNLDGKCPDPPIGPEDCCDTSIDPSLAEQCLDDADSKAEVKKLKDAGITTLVVGIPGTEAYTDTLDALAVAGGAPTGTKSPKYYAVSAAGGVSGLTDVFKTLTKGLIKDCDLQLNEKPPEPDKLNVELDGERIPQKGDDGWDYDDTTDPPTIRIKGATCERIETEGVSTVQVTYGCKTLVEAIR